MLDLPTLTPRDAAEVLAAVREAGEAGRALEIVGHDTKRGIGHSVSAAQMLDLSGLTGISFYEPDELVLSARAGTPLAEIETALGQENQELAFEPMDYGPLFGQPRGGGTLGGVLAANVSGPRRIKAGAARDHVLGVHAVSGRGEAFKSGGRVVKNVTGYDLSKGLAGSWGTLAVLTDVTFKVLPRAEAVNTLVVIGLDDRAAIETLCAAMGSAGEISGAAHLPSDIARNVPGLASSGAATLLRLEGFRPSVLYRAERVAEMIGGEGRELGRIDDAESVALWRAVRDVEPFAGSDGAVWRVSVAPTDGPTFVEALTGQKIPFRHFYDWSGGLVWLETDVELADAGVEAIRAAVHTVGGGHATLIRAANVEPSVPRFQPQPESLAALSKRLKEAFDPLNILNPGRMG